MAGGPGIEPGTLIQSLTCYQLHHPPTGPRRAWANVISRLEDGCQSRRPSDNALRQRHTVVTRRRTPRRIFRAPPHTSGPHVPIVSRRCSSSARDARALGAPKAELWPRWQQNDPSATEVVDHRGWAGFLASYVRPGADGVNRVAYAAVDPAGRAGLDGYLAAMACRVEAEPAEQMAYWINLYNALTVHVVLDHYPVASIRDIDISPGLFSTGPGMPSWSRSKAKN